MTLLAMACVTDKDEPVWSVGVGERCPDFSVTLSGGATVSTANLSGQTTLILFFDTACEDCRAILPVVQELYTEICDDESGAGRGKHVLAISRAQPAQSVGAYWAEHSLTIPGLPAVRPKRLRPLCKLTDSAYLHHIPRPPNHPCIRRHPLPTISLLRAALGL